MAEARVQDARAAARLAGVFGQSRSGTTWLGAIVDTHPKVAYRYEPFTRLARRREDFRLLGDELREGRASAASVRRLYELLLPANPRLSRPPFFEKNGLLRASAGRKRLWAPARALGPLGALYGAVYRPRGEDALVAFKEVDKEWMMATLARLGVRSLYIVRHPGAVVWSQGKGIGEGMTTRNREPLLEGLLRDHCPAAHARFGASLESLTDMQRWALLWRVGVEVAFRAAEGPGSGVHVVFYERLCERRHEEAERALAHLGLDTPAQTREFLDASSSGKQPDPRKYGVARSSEYFSVFRDPTKSVSKWRTEMPDDQWRLVREVVEDSPVYQRGVREGGWDRFA